MIARAAAGLAIAGLVLAGCADKVSGHAVGGGPGSVSTTPSASTGSSSTRASSSGASSSGASSSGAATTAPAAHLACPHVVDVAAHLAYDCVTPVMTRNISTVWPFKVERPVDTHWTMDEGSGNLSAFAQGKTPAATARAMVSRMVAVSYGTPVPKTKTERDADVTVGSVRAHLIQTLITLDPGYVKAQHLRVRQERLWIVIVPVGQGQVSGWYTSIPDVVRGSWPRVPGIINGLQIV